MQRVSSQLTLFLRIFIPTVWITSIASIAFLLSWSIRGKAGLLGNPFIWIGLLLILSSGIVVIWFLLWRLYRVDMDSRYVYISNYFRTFKYPFSDVAFIRDSHIGSGRIYCICLKSKGSFGKNIYFLASQVLWQDFVDQHPGLFELKK